MPTQKLADGTVVDYDAAGRILRQQLPDGTVFDQFTADGRPTRGSIPGSGQVSISYASDGSSIWSYADGMQVFRDPDGDVVRQQTPDGAVFDRFTSTGGLPTGFCLMRTAVRRRRCRSRTVATATAPGRTPTDRWSIGMWPVVLRVR